MGASRSPRRTARRLLSIFATAALGAGLLATTTGPAAAVGGVEGVPGLSHVFLIIGENTQLSQINAGNSPYLINTLAGDSAFLTNYWATTHYSESNYVAMTSGQFTECQQKDGKASACHQDVANIFQQLWAAGKTFTTWSESMPQPCWLLNTGGDNTLNHYAAKHNPQVFFDNVEGSDAPRAVNSLGAPSTWVDDGTQGGEFCQRTNLSTSASGSTPNDMSVFNTALSTNAGISDFNLVVPNECEDGHSNCKPAGNPIAQFDAFLANEVPLIQDYINAHGGLLIVTFDEGVTSSPKRAVKFGNGGNVAFLAWGPQVHPASYPQEYTHYSLLRTLEDGFDLGASCSGIVGPPPCYAGDAAKAQPIYNIWN